MKRIFSQSLIYIFVLAQAMFTGVLLGQEEIRNRKDGGYIFTIEQEIGATEVQSQDRTGTCWSYSTLSFLESELIRMGKGAHNLSEMYVVRNIYPKKVDLYVRMHGNSQLSPGGTFHDVMNVMKADGLVPEAVYSGKNIGLTFHTHGEMDDVIKGMADVIIDQKRPSKGWKKAVGGVLDAYLGDIPETFSYQGEEYSPQSFSEMLNIDPNDYVELSSFTHHPYYEKFVLEVPDNWDYNRVYNVPLDEMMEAIDHALLTGYTVGWDTDVSEKTFSHRNGIAVIPEKSWASMSGAEQQQLLQEPGKEKRITAEIRQEGFDDFSTTDDHLMHITGSAKDQNGSRYYIVKNSWGQNSNQCGGYLYASVPYVQYKTIHILMHKDALPKKLRKKLNL